MSHEIHHFAMGIWVFFLAYATAVVGSYVGLSCVRQAAKNPTGRDESRWLVMASLSIGGVGIWLTHFIGMMGFAVPGSVIRYDLGLTVFSVVLAVVGALFGLWIVNLRAPRAPRLPRWAALLVGGLVMGLAVSLMHYTGMAAIRIQGTLDHDPMYVLASVIIGIVASTAALWLAGVAEQPVRRVLAALIMGAAVVSLHYIGVAGVQGTLDSTAPRSEGSTVLALLIPAYVMGIIVLAVPIAALLLAPNKVDLRQEESIARWTSGAGPDTVPTDENSSAPSGYAGRSGRSRV